MALKVLIVDPSDEWLENAAKFLVEQFYEITKVNNGKDAQLALYNDKFFAVVMNFDTKNHSGMQVLKFIKTNHPSQRVVMVLESQEIIDSGKTSEEKLKKLGATEIAIKPFEIEHLKDLLEGHQSLGDVMSNITRREGQSDEVEVDTPDDQFTKVRIDDFYSAKAVLFDVYIQLRSNRYVKILHSGDTFSKERIDKYKNEKNVENLYFHNSDRRKFVQYHNLLAKKLIDNEKMPAQVKVKMLRNVTDKYVQEAFHQGMKPQVIDQGKQVCENIFNLVEKEKGLYQILKSYEEFDPTAFTHAFLVSLFSTAIIKQFDWQSKTTIEATAMACLFHDIGKMKLPKELLNKRPVEMNDEEMELYQTHPELGVEIIEGNRLINNSVKQIILQHHENFDGSGFPYGKRGSKILTLANIVSLADDFVHIMIDEELDPPKALRKMLIDQDQISKYNSMIVENFIKVFVDPEKIVKETGALPSNSKIVSKKVS
ncbi:HD domain-containing phosphohydrolase [Halobacteriovorax sp. HLS]|uniref:HD domain-containing phosphohydrolase n=1 Tax=Halobacteriovorax sp. HLS TaxID=2234000 RepID=UPI000FDAECA4|nr:HD domain-containing phosphohydrolase [Halobacteriovorax sp. HLS]